MTGDWLSLSQPAATLGDSDVGFVPRCRGPAPNQVLQRTERSRCSRPAAERERTGEPGGDSAASQNGKALPSPRRIPPPRALATPGTWNALGASTSATSLLRSSATTAAAFSMVRGPLHGRVLGAVAAGRSKSSPCSSSIATASSCWLRRSSSRAIASCNRGARVRTSASSSPLLDVRDTACSRCSTPSRKSSSTLAGSVIGPSRPSSPLPTAGESSKNLTLWIQTRSAFAIRRIFEVSAPYRQVT